MIPTNLTAWMELRRVAEEEAKRVLAEAVAALERAEAEQTRLQRMVEEAERAVARNKRGVPVDAAEGLARERFQQRLRSQRDRARDLAVRHREGALKRAQEAERTAAEAFRQAAVERQAAERLIERLKAEHRTRQERRNERRDEEWVDASHHHKPRRS